MSFQTTRSRFFELRAFLVIAALISLFVSKNVGPQFLPLPGLSDQAGESQRERQGNTASRSPLSASANFRVPMVGQTYNRVGSEVKPPPLATLAFKSAFEEPVDIQTTSDGVAQLFFLLGHQFHSLRAGLHPPYSKQTIAKNTV